MKKHILWILAILTVIIIIRIVDYSTISVLIDHEFHILRNLKGGGISDANEILYEYIGLSTYEKSIKSLNHLVNSNKNHSNDKKIIIVHYFDFFRPSRYLIYNKGSKKSILLSTVDVVADSGWTEVNLFKYDFVSIKSGGIKYSRREPVFGSWFDYFDKPIEQNEDHKFIIAQGDYNVGHTYFIKNIFVLYFYIPLVIIFYMSRKMNIQLSFFYFVIMLLFFKPADFLIGGMSFWIIPMTDISIIVKLIFVLVMILFISLVIVQIKKGARLLREKTLTLGEKYIAIALLLTAIILRF